MSNDVYYKLNLFKSTNTTLDTESKYCDIPEGNPDIERFLASQPAFRAAENQTLKKKKLIISHGSTSKDERIYNLKIIMMVRQLMQDGFEVYFNVRNQAVLAADCELATLIADNSDNLESFSDEELHHLLIDNLNLTYDDIAVLDKTTCDELLTQFQSKPLFLCQSDCCDLDIAEIKNLQNSLIISHLVNNMLNFSSKYLARNFRKFKIW